MIHLDYPVQMEISGSTALFARPDCGDSPISYPAPTYSCVKAMFEAVCWGPAVEIIPQKVEICAPVQYHSYAVNYGGPLRNTQSISQGNNYQMYATVLTDVCYRLYAVARPCFAKSKLPESARVWDSRTTAPGHAYQEIFNRRLKRGQSYGSLCLGWREFTPSYFGPFRPETKIWTGSEDESDLLIPSMLREVFSDGYASDFHPIFDTNIVIHKGVLIYPQGGMEN